MAAPPFGFSDRAMLERVDLRETFLLLVLA